MSCERYQERLLEMFGTDQVPPELSRHLEGCPTCRSFWRQLSTIGGRMGDDELFHLSDRIAAELADRVAVAVESRSTRRTGVVRRLQRIWYNYAPLAAAAVLVVGISLGIYLSHTGEESRLDTSVSTVGLPVVETGVEGEVELDQSTVQVLLYEFASQHSWFASELLLDDLTEEEFKYLESSFDVKEVL